MVRMRRALPFSVQLLLTFVGLLVGMAGVLTAAAYTSSLVSLEDEARRNVDLATRTREQTITQLFTLRQQRAEGLLGSIESLCTEPLDGGRVAWVDDCVRTMVDDFGESERASGALLTYGQRRIRRSGRPVSMGPPPAGALARLARQKDGAVVYVMTASAGRTTLTLQFDHEEVADLFHDRSGLRRDGEIFLVDYDGRFLVSVPPESPVVPAERAGAFLEDCRTGTDAFVDVDYRGVKAIQSFRPVGVLGTACVGARIGYDEALAPAKRLRDDLIVRAGWFVLIGAILSLVAA